MKKLGQLTLETLLWYGAALLIVLLAIGALVSFGVLDLGNMLPEKCNFGGSANLQCEDYKIDIGNDQIMLELSNKGTESVEIQNGGFNETGTGLVSGCNNIEPAPPVTVQPGQSQLINITCSSVDAKRGVRVTGEIELIHTLGDGSIEHLALGEISARATP